MYTLAQPMRWCPRFLGTWWTVVCINNNVHCINRDRVLHLPIDLVLPHFIALSFNFHPYLRWHTPARVKFINSPSIHLFHNEANLNVVSRCRNAIATSTRNLSISLEREERQNERGCTKIVVKCVLVDRFRTFFSQISARYMSEQLHRWKLLTGRTSQQSIIIWKLKYCITFRDMFSTQMRGRGQVSGLSWSRWKAHTHFPNRCSLK